MYMYLFQRMAELCGSGNSQKAPTIYQNTAYRSSLKSRKQLNVSPHVYSTSTAPPYSSLPSRNSSKVKLMPMPSFMSGQSRIKGDSLSSSNSLNSTKYSGRKSQRLHHHRLASGLSTQPQLTGSGNLQNRSSLDHMIQRSLFASQSALAAPSKPYSQVSD